MIAAWTRVTVWAAIVIAMLAYAYNGLVRDHRPAPAPVVSSPLPLPQLAPIVEPQTTPKAEAPAEKKTTPTKRKKIAKSKRGKPVRRVIKKQESYSAQYRYFSAPALTWPGDRR